MQEGKIFDPMMGDGNKGPKRNINRPKLISLLCAALFVVSGLHIMGGVGIFMASQGVDLDKIIGVQMVPGEETDDSGPIGMLSEEDAAMNANTPEFEPPATELAIYAFFMYLLLFISAIGLWNMKRWGVFLFLPLMAVNIAVLFLVQPEWLGPSQDTPWFSLLLPVIYLVVVAPFWKRIGKESEEAAA